MNLNLNNLQTAIFTIVLGIFFSAATFGQDEMTAVDRSALAGVRLPPGAQRVNEASVPAEIAQTMQKIVAEGKGKLRQGETEVLLWTGSDLKKAGAKSIVDRTAGALTAAGWAYEVSGTENGITFFSVLKGDPDRRGILGFFGEADGTLIFAWTEVHAAGGPQSTSSTATIDTASGDVSDYSFTTPSGWSRSDSASKITLTSTDGEKSVAFLPPMDSSGNLQRSRPLVRQRLYA